MTSTPAFEFPYRYGGFYVEKYNKIIKDKAEEFGCRVIDLYFYQTPYDSIDGYRKFWNV
jgi:hypothetical protein